jgi:hypothetical protein
VKPEISDVVDRLLDSRWVPWGRVIEDAKLHQPVEAEPAPDVVVAPYRWLLRRVGDGVRLTQAGHLPPAVVTEAVEALGWQREWIGKYNREAHTGPILELRESAQRFGLLRKYRGKLLMTKLGRRLADDPSGLWWRIAAQLPDARSEPERHSGVLYLLIVAAGRPRDDELLADGMSILGWADGRQPYAPLSSQDAFSAARDTWIMFHRLGLLPKQGWLDAPLPPSKAGVRLARAALLGQEPPSSAPPPRSAGRETAARAVQLTVTLRNIEPAIWRRLVVPATLTLRELHEVIQTSIGWLNYHLHLFDIDGVLYGDVEEIDDQRLGEEETFTVGEAVQVTHEFSYEYDFGDSWDHDIVVEQVMPSVGSGAPHLIGGARACPPEDCGGTRGYEHLLEVLADPFKQGPRSDAAVGCRRVRRRGVRPCRNERAA